MKALDERKVLQAYSFTLLPIDTFRFILATSPPGLGALA